MLASVGSSPGDGDPGGPDTDPEMLLKPEKRPISHEQMATEVKGIYAGLIMVEAKCIQRYVELIYPPLRSPRLDLGLMTQAQSSIA